MDEKKLQQQIVQLVQAAMQGNKQAQQRVQQIMQAAQQGDQQATQIAQMIQAVAEQMQNQQVQAAKFGAKLNYIRQLNGKCPDGYEMQSFKQGGRVCKKCVAKQSQNPVDSFRCGRKMQSGANVFKKKQKVSKEQQGGQVNPNRRFNIRYPHDNPHGLTTYVYPRTKWKMEVSQPPFTHPINNDTILISPKDNYYYNDNIDHVKYKIKKALKLPGFYPRPRSKD